MFFIDENVSALDQAGALPVMRTASNMADSTAETSLKENQCVMCRSDMPLKGGRQLGRGTHFDIGSTTFGCGVECAQDPGMFPGWFSPRWDENLESLSVVCRWRVAIFP